MIKHSLKEGNRVRVVTHDGGVQSQYYEKSYLFGATGIVIGVDPNFADVRIKLEGKGVEDIEEVDYRCLKRIDRTFEEIIKELVEKPEFKVCWNADFEYAERTVLLTNRGGFMVHIYDDGDVRFEADIENGSHTDLFQADEIAALAAACSEIADNYAAEHGKEEV